MRTCGILLPIFSLPNDYGIGTLGKEAYDFIDFLEKANQRLWQVLPIGPTSYGDSPYQSFSVFAGNPYFIDLDLLKNEGLLKSEEYSFLKCYFIDYGKLYETRFKVLKQAYKRFDKKQMSNFVSTNAYWLDDYATFMTIKNHFNGKSFLEWDDEYKLHNNKVIDEFILKNIEEIDFWKFLQFEFYKQWDKLKTYANLHNVKIIGDMPIYTALDSSDVWSNPKEFQLDKNLTPKLVAGCPPDAFSPLGQLWGNPLYDYKHMKRNHYKWWVKRVKMATHLFDIIRIDHFRGFEAYYAIPYGSKTAEFGHWEKGPNVSLFNQIKKELGNIDIIAENLGFLTEEVDIMLKKLNYPGMKILEFGFDLSGNSDAAIHNLTCNNVVYPGTHDNMPIRGWYEELDDKTKKYLHDYLYFNDKYDVGNRIIRAALGSVCNTCIINFADYLQKGAEARINTPSTLGNNWRFRVVKGDFNDDLATYIRFLTKLYNRNQN